MKGLQSLFIFNSLLLCCYCWGTKEEGIENLAVAGGKITLPCNITPSIMDDMFELVLWYKDDSPKPIYSLDGRTGSVGQARHASSDFLTGRAYFSTVDRPAVLVLDPVISTDEGSYRCRVDFHKERTRHFEAYVMVIVPPQKIVIKNQIGEVLQNVIGPLNEGESLTLICEVHGGKPSPSVTWWKDNILLDDRYETTPRGTIRNQLVIPALKRYHLMSTLICQASNNNISLPLSSSITLNMNFRPLTVTIVEKRLPLSSGKMVQLECRTNGSRPPAEITWWKGSTQLRSTKNRTNKDETLTSSFLTIRPSKEDAGKYLSCKAENLNMLDSAIEDGWMLEVYYPPELTLRLGSKLRHSHIQEGNDVYFECNIRANPWVTEIRWEFERRELQTNTTVGIIVSNQSLVLQKVRRSSRGHYTCSARNSEGVGESNAVYLRVQYAPICKPDQRTIYGVPKHDGVKVRCEVDADPSSVTFKWAFNNSVERLDIVDFVTSGTKSIASYIPRTEYDYGTLLCWASNSVGSQRQPCAFLVIPAGVPDPVHNCSVFNETDHSFRVECEAGYDGGLGQHFVMEVLDTPYLQLQANMTSPFPIFRARNLPSSSSFVVLVYAVNVRGASQKHFLRVSTHASPETQAHNVSDQWRLAVSSMLIILVSVAVGIILVAILIIFIIRYRRKKVSGRENGSKENEYKSKRNPEKYDSPASLNVLPMEEKCPDLIPGNSVHLHTNPSPDLKNHDTDEQSTPPLLRTKHEMLDRSAREFSPTERKKVSLTAQEPLSEVRDSPYPEGQRRVKKVLPARKHVEEQWFPFNSNHTNV